MKLVLYISIVISINIIKFFLFVMQKQIELFNIHGSDIF